LVQLDNLALDIKVIVRKGKLGDGYRLFAVVDFLDVVPEILEGNVLESTVFGNVFYGVGKLREVFEKMGLVLDAGGALSDADTILQ